MEKINWSKAPADATHWEPESDFFTASWMKLENGEWYFWGAEENIDGSHWWLAACDDDCRVADMIPRPTTWNDEGLPPVGTRCTYGGSEGVIVAHVTGNGEPKAIIQGASNWWSGSAKYLHHIRTPEQIAAEEREKAVNEMWMCIYEETPQHTTLLKKACADLYDAGYRKVDPV